jgi:hypothetical protein
VKQGKINTETQSVIFEALVGSEEPNENDNEAACNAALAAKSN